MNMLVETYEIEPASTEELTAIQSGEAKQLIEELGLAAQEKFFNPDTIEQIPYRKMTKREGEVFKILCPQECRVENYSDGPIPLRVLQVYQHAKALNFFDLGFVVWYPESADIKDPFLLGRKKVPNAATAAYGDQYYDTEQYLLARWGEELWSFEKMEECAVKLFRTNLRAKLAEIKHDVEAYCALLESGQPISLSAGIPYYHR